MVRSPLLSRALLTFFVLLSLIGVALVAESDVGAAFSRGQQWSHFDSTWSSVSDLCECGEAWENLEASAKSSTSAKALSLGQFSLSPWAWRSAGFCLAEWFFRSEEKILLGLNHRWEAISISARRDRLGSFIPAGILDSPLLPFGPPVIAKL